MGSAAKLILVIALMSVALLNQTKASSIHLSQGNASHVIYSIDSDVVQLPKITSAPLPAYPEEARKNKIEGVVLLKVVLHSSGRVTKVIPLKELPYGLTEESIDAAHKIEFQVGRLNGKAVSVYWKLEYRFSLTKGVSVNTAPDQ